MNKPSENGQLINAENVKTHEVFVFASDNKIINILKYNKSLFLANQFKDTLRAEQKRTLIGYSFGEDGNPTLYWGSENHKNIRIIKYNLETKTSNPLSFDFPANTGNVITSFQKNNTFYILSKEKDQDHLLLFEFRNEKCEIKMFDFTPFSFKNEKGQGVSFSALVQYHYPIEKIESDDFSSLDKSENKSKMFIQDDGIVLTFDYNAKRTQTFHLNFETNAVTEKLFDTPATQTPSTTNSFYLEKKLYQISANSDQLLFSIKDFDSGKSIKNVSISKNDSISFKNSPMFLQVNGEKPIKLKTTSKFLKQLSTVNSALSAFKSKQYTFITFGGFVAYQTLGLSYNGMDFNNVQNASKMVFFDVALSSDSEFVNNSRLEPLAIDNLNYFLSTSKNISLVSILKVPDFYILGYYDNATKSYAMRKFTDGFMDQNPGNPIMNKAMFTKSMSSKRN
ncbi:hypothetical protein ACQ9BO_01815 [Flavobacterium sp. P21]|uniref:hypothetical protein n=1 Tax=Flavobacterium sp. P21 TaxID=3423948 RepID=UPI003D671B7F